MEKNILYLSNMCSRKEYSNIFKKDIGKSVSWQGVKFNRLFAEGLVANDCRVEVLSSRPINRNISKSIVYKSKKDEENGVCFNYLNFINFRFLRPISLYLNAKSFIKKWVRENNDLIVCDILNFTLLKAAIKSKRNAKLVGIITDLPEILEGKQTAKIRAWNKMIGSCDYFVVLAEPMIEKLGIKGKPYVVIEGFCDKTMEAFDNRLEDKDKNNVIMYSGSIHKKYGISNLVESFLKLNVKSSELHIYGDGDWRDSLQCLCKTHKNIKYFGVKDNLDVVKAQTKAMLLVNPRPIDEAYVKYSFPSKNMEYLASGTPMLTTKLPSMPTEYYRHCFVVDNNDIDTLKLKLEQILKMKKENLHLFGIKAKNWALKNKNNISMTKKILDMVNTNE